MYIKECEVCHAHMKLVLGLGGFLWYCPKCSYLEANKKDKIAIRAVMSTRIKSSLLYQNQTTDFSVEDLLGCDMDFLMDYLESQFDSRMNWGNRGRRGWQIDHIKACRLFDLSDPKQQKECFGYKNIQVLWYKDHHKKSAEERRLYKRLAKEIDKQAIPQIT